jgi:hypothetical protein
MNKCGQLSLIEGVECGPSIRCLRAFNRRETKGFDDMPSISIEKIRKVEETTNKRPTRTTDELERIIDDLRDQWDESRSPRRDASFAYLAAVLELGRDMKKRNVPNEESQRMCEIARVANGERLGHPIRKIIAATSDADEKAASKMTRAARYAYYKNWIVDVEEHFKSNGGIKGCGEKFSEVLRERKSRRKQ